MASYCAVVPLPDADATGASATLRQAPCPRSLVAGLLLGVLTCAAILRLCHTSAGLGLHDPEPLLDIERLISLTADLNDQDLLSVANEPFQRYVNRTLQDSHIPQAFDVAANVGVAVCVVDVGQALFQLAQGLMAFNAASTGRPDFEDQSEEAKQFCAVAISYGFAGVAWSVSFISLAVSDCAASLDIQAACSADLTSLLGSFSYLSSAISSMTLNCPAGGLEDPAAIIAENSGGAIRRLQGETFHEIQTLEANKAAKKAAKATCVFDVGHAAFWLARVGTSITQATLHCTKQNVESDAGKVSCSVDVSGIVGAATFAASTIILAVAGCPAILDKDNSDLFCAASIIDTVGLAGYFAQAFSSIASTCGALGPQHL